MTDQQTMTPRAWWQIAILSGVWGGTFLAVRVALDEIGVMTVVLHRVFWAVLLLWAVVLLGRMPVPRAPRIWGAFLVMGLLNNVIPFGLQAWAQLHVPTGLVAIFNAGTAIFGMLVAALFLADERLTPRKSLGAVLGFGGVVTAIGIENLAALDVTSVAQLAVVASTISYAFAGVWARKTLAGVPGIVAAAGMLTGSTLVMLPLVLWTEGVPSLTLETRTWAGILYVSVAATAGAYSLYWSVLRLAGAANLMLCTLLIAPVAIVLGAVVLGEALTTNAYLGFALLALGLLVIDGRAFRRWSRGATHGA